MDLLQRDGYRLRAPEPEDLACMVLFENTTSLWAVSNTTGPYSRYCLKQYLETNKNDLYDKSHQIFNKTLMFYPFSTTTELLRPPILFLVCGGLFLLRNYFPVNFGVFLL